MHDLYPGAYIGGYTLEKALGSGGTASVWKARDDGGGYCAFKAIRIFEGEYADEQARQRLGREVAALAALNVPGVAGLLDYELDGVFPFIVTQLVEGPTLAQAVPAGGLGYAQCLLLASQLAQTLQQVHAGGILHRDLKPANVILAAGGPVLIDFGLAQGFDDDRLTGTGLVAGTPGYVAPEVLSGHAPSQASDWWAWAALVAFALRGAGAFGSGSLDTIVARVSMGQTQFSGIDESVAKVLHQALSPNPALRPGFYQVLQALDLAGEQTVSFPAPGPTARFPSPLALAEPATEVFVRGNETAGYGEDDREVGGAVREEDEAADEAEEEAADEAEHEYEAEAQLPSPLAFLGFCLAVLLASFTVVAWKYAIILASVLLVFFATWGRAAQRSSVKSARTVVALPWLFLRAIFSVLPQILALVFSAWAGAWVGNYLAAGRFWQVFSPQAFNFPLLKPVDGFFARSSLSALESAGFLPKPQMFEPGAISLASVIALVFVLIGLIGSWFFSSSRFTRLGARYFARRALSFPVRVLGGFLALFASFLLLTFF